MAKKQKTQLQKIVTRFYYPITLEMFFLASSKGLKKAIGMEFRNTIMKFDGKKLEAFRSIEELRRIKPVMLKYAMSKSFINKLPDYEKNFSKYNVLLNKQSSDFKEIQRFVISLAPMFFISYLVADLWIKGIPIRKRDYVSNLCYKYRRISDGILNKFDDYLVNYLKNKSLSSFTTLKEVSSLKQRKSKNLANGFIFYNGKFLNISWKEFLKENNFYYNEESIQEKRVLKGSPAFLGYIKGKVAIVFSPFDINKVKNNNILVTPMTQPAFIPIFPKVKAIITDEGGITCHAAIVSRELKIPCIVGTKVATKVLKDGDLVEVDAEKGIVKILEKTK